MGAVLGGVAALGVPVVTAPRPVHAGPPRCAGPTPAAAAVTATPWAQRRYGIAALAEIADGHGVLVAVIDSGVDARHPRLRGRVVAGLDLLGGGDGRTDCVGHGTAVASIVAAAPGSGFAGVAPEATILPVRISERSADEEDPTARTAGPADLARAILAAVDGGASVLNLSVVVYEDDPTLRAAVAYAERHDTVVVAAVGNQHDHGDPTPYPAAYPGVVGVGAIDESGARAPSSQVGPYVDLVAPGSDVLAASPPSGYRLYEGTSFAVPFVAGTAALLRQYRPDLSAAQVAARLTATADPVGSGRPEEYGAGEVDPYRAVTDALVSPTRAALDAAVLPDVAGRSAVPPPDGAAVRLATAAVLLAVAVAVATLVARQRAAANREGPEPPQHDVAP